MNRRRGPGTRYGLLTAAATMRAGLRSTVDALLAVSFAPKCAACASELDTPSGGCVCRICWSLVRPVSPPVCRTCGDVLPAWRTASLALERCARCRRLSPAISAGRAAGEYEGALRHIIHAFKYEGRRSLARPLGAMLRDCGADLLGDADFAIPIPLHPWRRLRRGFNQASDLAARVDVPVLQALWRSRATLPQSGLSAAARQRNVGHAFRLSPWLRLRTRRSPLAGRVLVLVDDVRTTGATLDACARVLREAGAREVRALTVAHAAPPARSRRVPSL